jgi:hypothetical protein
MAEKKFRSSTQQPEPPSEVSESDDRPEILMDLPSVTLATGEIAGLVERIEAAWDLRVGSISYPVMWIGGATTTPDVTFRSSLPDSVPSMNRVLQYCAESGKPLWLSLDLDLKPVRSDLVHIKAYRGNFMNHACVNTPATLEAVRLILRALRSTIAQHPNVNVQGIVYSLQDLWPMHGRRGTVDMTCFCKNCLQYFESHAPGLLDHFIGRYSPWDLVLRDDRDGVAHINALTRKTTPEELLTLSTARGFLPSRADADDESGELAANSKLMMEWAAIALNYAKTRSDLTAMAVKRLANVARAELGNVRVACVVSSLGLDWASGLFFEQLDGELADEYWTDASNSPLDLSGMEMRHYLFDRARYYLMGFTDALETTLSSTTRNLADIDDREMRELVSDRGRMADSRMMTSPISAKLLLAENPAAQIVVPGLVPGEVEALVDRFAPPDPGMHERELLAQLRALLPPEADRNAS